MNAEHAPNMPLASGVSSALGKIPAPSRMAVEWGMLVALWKRDLIRIGRERSRWLGVAAQPLLFWLVLGSGMGGSFTLAEAGAGDTAYLSFLFPGILGMVILFTTVFATMAVIEDRQHGFLQQVMVSPASAWSFVLGKVAGVTTVALVQITLCLLALPFAGIPIGGVSWPILFGAVVLTSAALTAVSIVLAWWVPSTAGYHGLMAVVLFPLWMVSGALFPPQDGVMGIVMAVNPMTYMVDGLRHALYGGSAPVAQLYGLPAAGALLGIALVFVAMATLVVSRSRKVAP